MQGCRGRRGRSTLAKNEIIYPKNVEAQVAMDFTYNE
jgi:hypothetical protein